MNTYSGVVKVVIYRNVPSLYLLLFIKGDLRSWMCCR